MKRKRIKSPLTDYFNFSSRERHGVLFLSCILIIQAGLIYYLKNKSVDLEPADPSIIASINKFMEASVSDEKSISVIENKNNINPPSYFKFDPNQMSISEWVKLGLSEKQVKVISNYIMHGGKFRIKSDFKKMYCISEKEYNNLKPFLLLPDTLIAKKTDSKIKVRSIVRVDIQNADSAEFIELRGIGSVLASRIVKYREKLGGFYSINQLKEVWGINDTVFLTIRENVFLPDTIPFRSIHLNTDSFNILAAHPYIKGKIAGLICNFRKQHKSFETIDELKQLPLITEENFLKLAPYLLLD